MIIFITLPQSRFILMCNIYIFNIIVMLSHGGNTFRVWLTFQKYKPFFVLRNYDIL